VAFMVLLETLSPEERATFLLREVFDYSYADIAPVIDSSEANCRQIFHRAKERIAERRPRARQSSGHKRQLVGRFVNAMRSADGAALTSLLAEDVGFWGDGGGKVIASRRPVLGREHVVRLLVGIMRTAPAAGVPLERTSVEIVDVNYEPAMVVRVDSRIDSVYTYSIAGEVITGIRVIRNPDKLAYFARQLAGSRLISLAKAL